MTEYFWFLEVPTITQGENFRLEIPEGVRKLLKAKGYMQQKVIFGIRPEDVSADPLVLETFPNAIVEAEVLVSELLGSDSILYCKIGSQEFSARVDAQNYLAPGEKIKFAFKCAKGHFFDPRTGQRIAL